MRNGKVLVYIAGPHTTNTRAAMMAWAALQTFGLVPICPHWTMFQHFLTPLPYEAWLDYDRVILSLCDAVLRLPGKSEGADKEVEFATHNNIPVFFNGEALFEYYKHVLPS
jgi:hypothetical protein